MLQFALFGLLHGFDLLEAEAGLIPPILAELHQLVLLLVVNLPELVATASRGPQAELVRLQHFVLQFTYLLLLLFDHARHRVDFSVQSDRLNRVLRFLARGVLLLDALELALRENGVGSEDLHDLLLVEQQLLASGVRHAARGLCVVEGHGGVARDALVGFVHFVLFCLRRLDQGRDVLVEPHQAALTAGSFGHTQRLPLVVARHIRRSTARSPVGGSQVQLLLQVFVGALDLLVLRLVELRLGLPLVDLLLEQVDRRLRGFVVRLLVEARFEVFGVVLSLGVWVLVGPHLLSSEAVSVVGRRVVDLDAAGGGHVLGNPRGLLDGGGGRRHPVVEFEHEVVVLGEQIVVLFGLRPRLVPLLVLLSLVIAFVALNFPLHFIHDLEALFQLHLLEVLALLSGNHLGVVLLELGALAALAVGTDRPGSLSGQ